MKTWFYALTIFIFKQFDHHWKLLKTLDFNISQAGFSTGVENMKGGGGLCLPLPPLGRGSSKFDGGGDLSPYMGRARGGLKMLLKNTCEGVHLIIKLPAISLQACKFTKNELLHICAFSTNHFMEGCFTFQWGVCFSDGGRLHF